MRLLQQAATVVANMTSLSEPCPGSRPATRLWYSIKNPATQKCIPDFYACCDYAKMVEALLLNLRGVFIPLDSPTSPMGAVYAMQFTGTERRRFTLYFDVMETTSDAALAKNVAPDIERLAKDIERPVLYTECHEDRVVHNGNWHIMQGFEDFTVCGECFDEVLREQLETQAAQVARRFYLDPQKVRQATCQLYLKRMREVFRRACRNNDFAYLDAKVDERRRKEDEIQRRLVDPDEHGDFVTKEQVDSLNHE